MSKRSFKTCNTKEQEIRWRIKIRLKKLFRSWCFFKSDGGKGSDYDYHWARMLRSIDIIEDNLVLLSDEKRICEVRKRIKRLETKLKKYREEWKEITSQYRDGKKFPHSKEYRKTVREELKRL